MNNEERRLRQDIGIDERDSINELDEEMATEIAPSPVAYNRPVLQNPEEERPLTEKAVETGDDEAVGGRGMGILALVLSILSLFMAPIILGAAGIIIGFIARRRGAAALGAWSIGLGILSIVTRLLISPFI
ncbi:hypothetical protein CIB95_04880 [Lottiidibacillus patelloidae]|uniref:DUF4190 domain-containing protein n=1 Tax=Lottiidibacillus patelloidae TaxID=2670334 RepID=A0A263BVB9_9BACI|nr:hypothetical protein [Lottiidibacillus patelloidae]OZM57703.1 hypothetical protein CIB95_04880 [Lottiidibacillus patelloidae]